MTAPIKVKSKQPTAYYGRGSTASTLFHSGVKVAVTPEFPISIDNGGENEYFSY